MKSLPESYVQFLAGRDAYFVDTVLPVLQQSAADERCGVRIVLDPRLLQAHLDPRLPYGTIVEDVD